jgi:hypothetical protein
MLERIPPVPPGEADPYGGARNVRATERSVEKFSMLKDAGIPPTPPPDVLNALDSAARVHNELRARGLNVSFDVQPNGGVRVSVIDGSGTAVKTLSPSQALDDLSGEVPLDELGV